ncbi:GNAT family N-acetyltransferase [Myxacorys almedinensis]|uniref:GNAT family N-acetyltransferase n=1 Tax=Myxacorys almedinensis A TaxID=2690445 RepID=A0A8J8CJF2_9CYAN|nr:GNAT family N-acetyltransferase [Myxacorys almedinensis]NDJ18604.1 GNAT family N-acetyltransferase [Myxacorys almedinensis A]
MNRIRAATEADLPAIVAIYNSTIASHIVTADVEPVTVESRLEWLQHRPRYRPVWVMELDAAIAGWLSIQSFYGRPAYAQTVELSLYVSEQRRRQGVGKTLLAYAIAQSPSLDISTLLGFIFAENQPSIHLFNQFGFEQWGFLPTVAHIEGEDRNLVILGRKI